MTVIRGSDHKVSLKFGERLKFPGKNEPGRPELEDGIIQAGKWQEVSQLDTNALTKVVHSGQWDSELIDGVMSHGRVEETSSIYLSRLKESEE